MALGFTIPTLQAGPFTLRPFEDADVDLIREASTAPDISATRAVPSDVDEEDALAFIQRQASRARAGEGYSFAIAEDGTAIGHAGLWPVHADAERAVVDYWVAPSHRGRHAALHALKAIAAWAFDDLGILRLELTTEPDNEYGIRIAQQAGFHPEGTLRSWAPVGAERHDMRMFSMLSTDERF
jgi:RimJ/RimL family protein N-acetyltransferase